MGTQLHHHSLSTMLFKHISSACALLAGYAAAGSGSGWDNGISIACGDDNTINVTIVFNEPGSEILDLEYGSCDESSRGLDQNADNGFFFTLDSEACNVDTLKSIEYAQDLTVVVGKQDQGSELVLAKFEVTSYCQLKQEYTIDFNYGTLEAEVHDFSGSGGLTKIEFNISAYDEHFDDMITQAEQPSQAGDMIYIGVIIETDSFDYTAKKWAMKECIITDATDATLSYTLFDDHDCTNDIVKLSVYYNGDYARWEISHMLFLLDNHDSSSYTLTCKVLVCDNRDAADCQALIDNCA